MNDLLSSFIGSLREWVRDNHDALESKGVTVTLPAYTFHSGIRAGFTSGRFESDFYLWEKGHSDEALGEIEFVDWRVAFRDPEYEPESLHYQYATVGELRDTLNALRDRLILIQSEE